MVEESGKGPDDRHQENPQDQARALVVVLDRPGRPVDSAWFDLASVAQCRVLGSRQAEVQANQSFSGYPLVESLHNLGLILFQIVGQLVVIQD